MPPPRETQGPAAGDRPQPAAAGASSLLALPWPLPLSSVSSLNQALFCPLYPQGMVHPLHEVCPDYSTPGNLPSALCPLTFMGHTRMGAQVYRPPPPHSGVSSPLTTVRSCSCLSWHNLQVLRAAECEHWSQSPGLSPASLLRKGPSKGTSVCTSVSSRGCETDSGLSLQGGRSTASHT